MFVPILLSLVYQARRSPRYIIPLQRLYLSHFKISAVNMDCEDNRMRAVVASAKGGPEVLVITLMTVVLLVVQLLQFDIKVIVL